jgi:putative nucleotidyltransferase with HDIG domain
MILSGYADEGAALRSVPVAHRFLNKPCDAAELSAALIGACELQDRLSRPELRTLVSGLGLLPSVPTTFAAMTEALGRTDACAETVVPIVEQDPGCSAKLLQLVNSAYFGLPRKITSIHEAVSYLGLIQVRNVVLTTGIADLFRTHSAEVARATNRINRHSLAVAAAAREMAPASLANDAFVAGMLHDIGELVLATVLPEKFLEIRKSGHDDTAWVEMEQAMLGATHADVGAYLLRLWGLPFQLVDAVARHHDPHAEDHPDRLVAVVAAAERLGHHDRPQGYAAEPERVRHG